MNPIRKSRRPNFYKDRMGFYKHRLLLNNLNIYLVQLTITYKLSVL